MKAHVAKFFVALALFVAVTGSGIVAEFVGYDAVPSAAACSGNGSGGGC